MGEPRVTSIVHGYEVDEYNTVMPTEVSAMQVARDALDGGAIINLYLGGMTSMNILFVVTKHGLPKDSYRIKDLTVGIDRISMYQFNLPTGSELHLGYVEEKLKLGGINAKTLAEFITSVQKYIMVIHGINRQKAKSKKEEK